MQSLPAAAKLLELSSTPQSTLPLLESLGFTSGLIPLSPFHLSRLGIITPSPEMFIAHNEGILRALVFDPATTDTRNELTRIANKLAANAAELLWIIIATNSATGETAIAAVDTSGSRPRITLLLARRDHIVDSDSETLCGLIASPTPHDHHTHQRWTQTLGRQSICGRFYKSLEVSVEQMGKSLRPHVESEAAAALALLYVSRLIFLSFLETKGWLDGDHAFLSNQFADCMLRGGSYHRKVLAPLFFGTLNTRPAHRSARARDFGRIPFLNGGLFSRSALERRTSTSSFSDESLGDLFGDVLSRYRFTAREDTTRWSEAAVDPEMLGKAFETLMSSRDRKRSGAFYTPQSLVAQLTSRSLAYALSSDTISEELISEVLAGSRPDEQTCQELLESIDELTVLDPACGSGAFLVHALEELSQLRQRLGDKRPLHGIRRSILTRSIFGVDVNPMAAWLCELRLWLSMAIEDPEKDPCRVTPLPNLDRNVRTGNSLMGEDFSRQRWSADGKKIARLRGRYVRSSGPRKKSLARALDAAERARGIAAAQHRTLSLRAERRELVSQARMRDLFGSRSTTTPALKAKLVEVRKDIRESQAETRGLKAGAALPFSFPSGFADIAARGGFDVVIGNPPWVRTHNFDKSSRDSLKRHFDVYRNSAWEGGSEASSAGRGFSSQVDAAALFAERAVKLLRPNGVAGLVLPSKLWRSLAGGGVRDLILSRSTLREVHDMSSSTSVFDAAVYPSLIIMGAHGEGKAGKIRVSVHRNGQPELWTCEPRRLSLDASPGSPWILVPARVRRAFDAFSAAGVPLCRSSVGRPLLGTKTGCNEAFLAALLTTEDEGFPEVYNSRYGGQVEGHLLRPVVAGRQIRRWVLSPDDNRILWAHDPRGAP